MLSELLGSTTTIYVFVSTVGLPIGVIGDVVTIASGFSRRRAVASVVLKVASMFFNVLGAIVFADLPTGYGDAAVLAAMLLLMLSLILDALIGIAALRSRRRGTALAGGVLLGAFVLGEAAFAIAVFADQTH